MRVENGNSGLDTIEYTLQVKSSIASMVIGALLGGFRGWFTAKGSVAKYDVPTIVSLGVSLVAAAMAVVLFARKKDIQPLIAVEDLWGGLAVGFVVAYSGPKMFERYLGNTQTLGQ